MSLQALTARAAAGALFVALVAAPVHAQRAHVGPHGGYNLDSDHALVGAQMLLPIVPLVEQPALKIFRWPRRHSRHDPTPVLRKRASQPLVRRRWIGQGIKEDGPVPVR